MLATNRYAITGYRFSAPPPENWQSMDQLELKRVCGYEIPRLCLKRNSVVFIVSVKKLKSRHTTQPYIDMTQLYEILFLFEEALYYTVDLVDGVWGLVELP